MLAPVLELCAELRLIRYIADEALRLRPVLETLRTDPTLAPRVPSAFIRKVLEQPGLHQGN